MSTSCAVWRRLTRSAFRGINVRWALKTTQYLRSLSTGSTPAELNSKLLVINRTKNPKPKVPEENLVFGKYFTDHMLEIPWNKQTGWGTPVISPFHNLSLSPSTVVFHYGLEVFEGMKAYKDAKGQTRLFRPQLNMERMNRSAARLALPTFNGNELLELLKQLLRVDSDWIPRRRGYSLYIRPTLIGTETSLGVAPSNSALLYIILSPVGPYYASGFKPIKLVADETLVRAWPGGTGAFKVGGNYAPTIAPLVDANQRGYSQMLWLFGENAEITEVGSMNLFIFWINTAGEAELVTHPLDGTVLPGVTRRSVLELAREWNEFKVSERKVTMRELLQAQEEGRIIEVFGAGTAAIISPVSAIHYRGKDYNIPLGTKQNKNPNGGELSQRLMDTILSIQYGEKPSPWSVVVE